MEETSPQERMLKALIEHAKEVDETLPGQSSGVVVIVVETGDVGPKGPTVHFASNLESEGLPSLLFTVLGQIT